MHFMAEQTEAISYKPTARIYGHGVGVGTMRNETICLKTTTIAPLKIQHSCYSLSYIRNGEFILLKEEQ